MPSPWRRGPRRQLPARPLSKTPSTRPCVTGSLTSAPPSTSSARLSVPILTRQWSATSIASSSKESKRQILDHEGRLPDAIVACVGGGSNAIGAAEYIPEPSVELIGVEAGGRGTALRRTRCALPEEWGGLPGVLQGHYSYVLQNDAGQIAQTQLRLRRPRLRLRRARARHAARFGSCPLHPSATDTEALEATKLLSRTEGIIFPRSSPRTPSPKPSSSAPKMGRDKILMVNVSGRGDKDMGIPAQRTAVSKERQIMSPCDECTL